MVDFQTLHFIWISLLLLQLLKKSVIVADFEKKDTVPPYKESRHATKLKRRVSKRVPQSVLWYFYAGTRSKDYGEDFFFFKCNAQEERAKTTGDGWFNMSAPELTEELKNDLKALQMRSAVDPKRFYKKNDRQGLPKYFEVRTNPALLISWSVKLINFLK